MLISLIVLLVICISVLVLIGCFYVDSRKERENLEQQLEKAKSRLTRYKGITDLEDHKSQLKEKIEGIQRNMPHLQEEEKTQTERLAQLRKQVEVVEEQIHIQDFGFYRPKYGFEDSERYMKELTSIRDKQKTILKDGKATKYPDGWTVNGSITEGKKMMEKASKIMLRAFNGECDAAIGQVKYNNANNLEQRITRSYEAINKMGTSNQMVIANDYLQLKLQELHLVHEHREKLQEEKEEQQRIREQMREEAEAEREIEEAKKKAEIEEADKEKALIKAKEELAKSSANNKQMDRLKAIVDKLEFELKEALERKAKAIARAQLTKSGHIYVLSNIGSFGEDVYKIGMTRRLEPLERVYELGDASVPFRYDVHAIIYSENAPALEHKLHVHFKKRRVNMVNPRREFFRVSLEEIQEAVEEHFGVVTFTLSAEAEEYRKTLAMIKDSSNGHLVSN